MGWRSCGLGAVCGAHGISPGPALPSPCHYPEGITRCPPRTIILSGGAASFAPPTAAGACPDTPPGRGEPLPRGVAEAGRGARARPCPVPRLRFARARRRRHGQRRGDAGGDCGRCVSHGSGSGARRRRALLRKLWGREAVAAARAERPGSVAAHDISGLMQRAGRGRARGGAGPAAGLGASGAALAPLPGWRFGCLPPPSAPVIAEGSEPRPRGWRLLSAYCQK